MINDLEIADLKKDFSNKTETLNILRGVNLALTSGERISITGESGSGKTTLLNLIGGLDYKTGGSIKIEGTEITNLSEDDLTFFRNKKIGFIFQSHYLLDEFTALENVMIPKLVFNYNKKDAKEKSMQILEFIGMKDRIDHFPNELSGGEKQRVAIARAIINNPKIILADEPTGSLDERNSGKIIELLYSITEQEKISLIMVTHSKHLAELAEKHYHLENGFLNEQ